MLAHIDTVAFLGITSYRVNIQVHIADGGLPSFNIVGLADKSIAESRERVRAAFSSIGLGLPAKRITVNLSPADLLKEGTHFDLGIAMGLLTAMQIIPQEEVLKLITMGELALDGSITKVNGVLPAAIFAAQLGYAIVCPKDNGPEASYAGSTKVLASSHIMDVIKHFTGKVRIAPVEPYSIQDSECRTNHLDMKDVKGQEHAKKAIEIAAAGNHNMLMIGPPGSGKSMLAKRVNTILPPLTHEEAIEVSIIRSIAGETQAIFTNKRPFRDPHSSSSAPAIVGGGAKAKPGEMTLAHRGVLFLDELPEFNRSVIDAMRQPMEDGRILISRAHKQIEYPAKCLVIAAMNPCKCGYFGSESNTQCRSAPKCAVDYQNRISGPVLDRFDLQVEVGATKHTLFDDNIDIPNTSSKDMENRVLIARQIQRDRYRKMQIAVANNSELDGENLHNSVVLSPECKEMLRRALDKFKLSMRGINRVLRVARTTADLDGWDNLEIRTVDLATALNYRLVRI